MRYFVVDLQGAQYGPADIQLLNQWAAQGRIVPSTTLVEENTGRHISAASVPGLILLGTTGPGVPGAPAAGGPFGPINSPGGAGPFGRATDGSWEANTSFMLSGVSAVLCFCIPCLGLVPAFAAAFYGFGSLQKGYRLGSSAIAVAVLAIILQIAAAVGGLAIIKGFAGG